MSHAIDLDSSFVGMGTVSKDNIGWVETFKFWNSFKHLGNGTLLNIFVVDQRTGRMASKMV